MVDQGLNSYQVKFKIRWPSCFRYLWFFRGPSLNYTLLHHSSCVLLTSDTHLYRREKKKERTVDTLRRNDDASIITLLSGQKVRRRVWSACFTYWHIYDSNLRVLLDFIKIFTQKSWNCIQYDRMERVEHMFIEETETKRDF
jgi:hypothetical protein